MQNFAANVALAVGASPIMANYAEEAADLAKLGGSLVINMGTVTPEGLKNHVQALQAYNAIGGPVVLDPVGCVVLPPLFLYMILFPFTTFHHFEKVAIIALC